MRGRVHPDWLAPGWTIPGVSALMTTRNGGVSQGPWQSMNLGAACGDDPADVVSNRESLHSALGPRPVFMQQVHGVNVVHVDAQSQDLRADGCFSTQPGVACTVLAADCLPLLFAASNGKAVGAAHAGWRGLAAGVVEATLQQVCEAAGCDASGIQVWLGACIGPLNFEVGGDVLRAFGVGESSAGMPSGPARFKPAANGKWLADLPGIARDRLAAAGVLRVSGGSWCTAADQQRFFSYRRDNICGRMAACIWIER